MLAHTSCRPAPRPIAHQRSSHVLPCNNASKLWPAQIKNQLCSLHCRAAAEQPPPESRDSSPATPSRGSSSSSSDQAIGQPQRAAAPQQQAGTAQGGTKPTQQATAPASSLELQQQQDIPQQQQKQQQIQQQQRHEPKQQPPKQAASSKSAKSTPKAGKQQQQPFFLVTWLRAAAAAVLRVPTTLLAFLAGGLASAFLLYSWALGSPLKHSRPYRFTMVFNEASKVDVGTPVRMKGVQIGNIASVALHASHVEAVAQVADASNIIPQGSRVDINLLGIAADPWIDITPPPNALVRKDHGPHHPACASEGLIVCHNGSIRGQLGGSTDFMMKFFLSQHDRARVKVVDAVYHGKHV